MDKIKQVTWCLRGRHQKKNKNMRHIFLIIAITCIFSVARAQDKILLSQYFQNMPAFSPALTGANDFLDLRMGYRQQWMGFDGAPRTLYISGYGALDTEEDPYHSHTLRTSDSNEPHTSGIKHGVGGNLELDEQGPYSQTEFNLNYAVHVPVSERTYLSFGVSPGIYNAKIDFTKAEVKDMTSDQAYQDLLTNGGSANFFQLSSGLALYSDRYYAAYSMMQLVKSHIGGNENLDNNGSEIRHQVMGGYRFFLSQDVELVPNAFVRMQQSTPLLWDAGARVQYKRNFWLGASYRNDKSIIGMVGLVYNDKFKIGYSYEHKSAGVDGFNSGSHELVLGLQLFNHNRYVSMW